MKKYWIMSFFIFQLQVFPQQNVTLADRQMRLALELAESLYVEGKITQAFYMYQDFIEMYPDSQLSIDAYERLAQIYTRKQRYLSASKVYEHLYTRLGPSERGLRFRLQQASLQEQMGQYSAAADIYREIISERSSTTLAEEAETRLKLTNLFLNS